MIEFRRIHIVETFNGSGGGIPRVIRNIEMTCRCDYFIAANELSFREALINIFGLKGKATIIFLHNIYSPRAILYSLVAKLITRGLFIISTHGATNIHLLNQSKKKKAYLKLVTPVLSAFAAKFHFLNTGEQLKSYINYKVYEKVVVFPYPVWAPSINVDYKMGIDHYVCLVFYSRVELRKGIFELITAANQLHLSGFNVELKIYGPLFDDQIIEAISTSCCTSYHGEVDIEVYSRSLNANSVFCLPSYGEANSLALLEHVIMGVPCIVSSEANSPDSEGINVYGTHSDILALKNSIVQFSSLNSRYNASCANLLFTKNNLAKINTSLDSCCEMILIEANGNTA